MNINSWKSPFLRSLGMFLMPTFLKFRLRRAALVLGAVALPASSPAHAAAWCDGTVRNIYVDRSGQLAMLPTFRGDWVALCNLEAIWKGVPPTTCAGWMTTMTSALLSGKPVTIQYPDPITTCSALPTYYDAPSPNYVGVAQ